MEPKHYSKLWWSNKTFMLPLQPFKSCGSITIRCLVRDTTWQRQDSLTDALDQQQLALETKLDRSSDSWKLLLNYNPVDSTSLYLAQTLWPQLVNRPNRALIKTCNHLVSLTSWQKLKPKLSGVSETRKGRGTGWKKHKILGSKTCRKLFDWLKTTWF